MLLVGMVMLEAGVAGSELETLIVAEHLRNRYGSASRALPFLLTLHSNALCCGAQHHGL
jgi:hypothetical protein